MKISLLFIGKESAETLQSTIQQYIDKLKHYAPFEVVAIPYLKNTKNISIPDQKKREGELFLKKIAPSDFVVLLDERGKSYTSLAFSQFIQQKLNMGVKHLVFVIGGAYGFSEAVYQRAQAKWSLSELTFPHILCRLFFTEQLYRAFSILNNEPYHHEG